MDAFLGLDREVRIRICQETSARRGMSATAIEKDFWVCWTLRELFSLPDLGEHLTFKGGTSLSKCWGLISRFSEDIDVVIDRALLGFGGDTLNRSQIKRLRERCPPWIQHELLPLLQKQMAARLGTERGWVLDLAPAHEDPDRETLHFSYPPLDLTTSAYIRPVVRIELGARSEIEPSESPIIVPYAYEEFPELVGASAFAARTIAPRRTFIEKMMLLHEERFRPASRPQPERMSRHYYDLWAMLRHGIGDEVLSQPGLVAQIAQHRESVWRQSWVDYSTMKNGTWNFMPTLDSMGAWERDYGAMREMLFEDAPDFGEILRGVEGFQTRMNHLPSDERPG